MTDGAEIRTAEELEALVGSPSPRAAEKVHRGLTELHRLFLSNSPFCLVATAAADGSCDVSPKGDYRGFAMVLDAETIAIPDRPGSRRLDGFHNVLSNPNAGLLFLIPGRADALRINGRARIMRDAHFFDEMAVEGVRPPLALLVEVEEILLHHSGSFLRSGIWNTASWGAPDLPSEAELADALEGPQGKRARE